MKDYTNTNWGKVLDNLGYTLWKSDRLIVCMKYPNEDVYYTFTTLGELVSWIKCLQWGTLMLTHPEQVQAWVDYKMGRI